METGNLFRRVIYSKSLSVADSEICNSVTGSHTETQLHTVSKKIPEEKAVHFESYNHNGRV